MFDVIVEIVGQVIFAVVGSVTTQVREDRLLDQKISKRATALRQRRQLRRQRQKR